MSIDVMVEVWEHSKHKGSTLLCLLAMADRANNDGGCYPGIPWLSKRVRVSERQIFNIIDKLLESDEIRAFNRMRNEGGFTSNAYVIICGCSEQEIIKRLTKAEEEIRGIIKWDRPEADFSTPLKPASVPPLKPISEDSSIDPPDDPKKDDPSVGSGKNGDLTTGETITAKHPAIQAYRNAAHRYPPKSWYPDIAEAVGEKPADVQKWESVVHVWVGKGWNPGNVSGMLNVFDGGFKTVSSNKTQQPESDIGDLIA